MRAGESFFYFVNSAYATHKDRERGDGWREEGESAIVPRSRVLRACLLSVRRRSGAGPPLPYTSCEREGPARALVDGVG
jgi:hypothetical protein